MKADQRTHQRHWHRQQDDQRVDKTFIETCEQQVHHHDAEAEQQPGGARGLAFFFGETGEGQGDVVASNLLAGAFQQPDRFTAADPGAGTALTRIDRLSP